MKKSNKQLQRESGGFSLLYVLTVGLVTLLGVMAVTDALVATQRSAASQAYLNEATSAAENALQYAIGKLNQAAGNGTLSQIPVPSTIPIPASILGDAEVVLTMTSVPYGVLSNTKAPTPISSQQSNPIANQSQDFRLLTAVAKCNVFHRTINVVLGPNVTQTPSSTTPSTNYFNQAILSNSSLQLNGVSVQFDPAYVSSPSYSTASYGQIVASSNGQMTLSGQVFVDGSLNAPSYSFPQPVPQSNGGPLISPILVNGNVAYTGPISTPPANLIVDPGGPVATLGANVLGDSLTGGPQNSPGTIANSAAITQQAPAQTQLATVIAQPVITEPTPGNVAITIASPAPNAVADLGAINLASDETLTLSPGQYVVSSISTLPGSQINLNMPNSGTIAPVQIYVQGDSPGINNTANTINLQGNINAGGASASNLQIFYNGSGSIQGSGLNFRGQIYAPNASVAIDTTGGVFNGSIVSNQLNLSGTGSYYYDPRTVVGNSSGASPFKGAAPGPAYNPASLTNPNRFFVLSWQEMTGN